MKIAILTSKNQWFIPYAKLLQKQIKNAKLFFNHKEIEEYFDIVFILSYHYIIEQNFLKKHRHNIVIHASDLPEGKGWAPLFWQVIDGKNEIVFSMFEAGKSVDDGAIYMKKRLFLTGHELNKTLRKKQAIFTLDMCMDFITDYEKYHIPTAQKGVGSVYPKREVSDSELDILKTIEEQFNLLRIVDNEAYPAFFYKNGKKYIVKIEEADENK